MMCHITKQSCLLNNELKNTKITKAVKQNTNIFLDKKINGWLLILLGTEKPLQYCLLKKAKHEVV